MASFSPRCEIRQPAVFVYPGGIKAPDAERIAVFYGHRGRPVKKPRFMQSLGETSWPPWDCEVSTLSWTYDEQETCLLLAVDVMVSPDGGDLVVFEAGLSCSWDVRAQVRKHCRQSGAHADPAPAHTAREHRGDGVKIGRELAEIEQAIGSCRGDLFAEPKLTGIWMAHLLISSKELLQNLLIDTAPRPQRINAPE